MRRLALVILVCTLVVPASAFAGSWRLFRGGSLGLTVRYPSTWHIAASYVSSSRQVTLGYSGRTNYSLMIQVLPIKPAGNLRVTLQRSIAYEQHSAGTLSGHLNWRPARVGIHPSIATIVRPSTEGGVAMAEAIYVTQSRHHVYVITEVAYSHPSPSNLGRFPAVYRQILQTLQFR